MCGRAYETYTDKELNARYIRGAPTADDIQQLCKNLFEQILSKAEQLWNHRAVM